MPQPRLLPLGLGLPLAVVALALCAALLAACDGEGGGRDVSGVDADPVLREAADALAAAESFHVHVTHENGSTEIINGLAMTEAEGDYAGVDRLQLDISARAFGANISSGVVILPEAQYLKNPINGRWVQQPIDFSQVFDPSAGVSALMRGVTDAEVVRAESLRGVECYVIEATVDSGELRLIVGNAQAGRAVDAVVWVGVEDARPYRAEVRGPVAADDAADVVRRVDLSAFDEPVEIAAPQ